MKLCSQTDTNMALLWIGCARIWESALAQQNNGADLPVAELVDSFYAEVQEMGGARWDTSSLLARLTRK